ncbi:hypothetical protein DOO78_23520 [Roseicella frigidaeris]|uniref:Tail fiber domain-containing protein n=1 Tax=Roseicella frigidaeris TaxID=2230885 RepID=A0A327LZ57_9PROT|nr:hypothetical protein DOO78_23520 [Roseicella frigidaeris]
MDTARTNAALNRVNQVTPYGNLTYTNSGADWAQQQTQKAKAAYDAGTYTPTQNGGQFDWNTEYQGALNADWNPYKDTWTATTSLSPEQQTLYNQTVQGQTMYGNAALRGLSQLQDKIGSPVDYSGVPAAGQAYQQQGQLAPTLTQDAWQAIDPNIGYGAQSRERVEQAMFDRLSPVQAQQRAAQETSLRNQGLTPGSEAYTNAMRDLGQQENDARLAVIAAGGQEEATQANIANTLFNQKASNRDALLNAQNTLFGQQAASRGLFDQEQEQQFNQSNALRQQSINEMLAQRQIPLNEIAALLGGQQVQYPQLQTTPQSNAAGTDYVSLINGQIAAQNNAYNAKVQNAASGNATTGTVAASLISALASAAASRQGSGG